MTPEKFVTLICPTEEGHHIWRKGLDAKGRPRCWHDGSMWLVRRWIWERVYGSIPKGIAVVSDCGESLCVAIGHLTTEPIAKASGRRRTTVRVSEIAPTSLVWLKQAACAGMDTALFFDKATADQAIAVCESCPVALDCLRYAKERRFVVGVFGGEKKRCSSSSQ